MLCEMCQKRKAETVLRLGKGRACTELYVCHECAALAHGQEKQVSSPENSKCCPVCGKPEDDGESIRYLFGCSTCVDRYYDDFIAGMDPAGIPFFTQSKDGLAEEENGPRFSLDDLGKLVKQHQEEVKFSTIVMRSRFTVQRNIKGLKFPNRMSKTDAQLSVKMLTKMIQERYPNTLFSHADVIPHVEAMRLYENRSVSEAFFDFSHLPMFAEIPEEWDKKNGISVEALLNDESHLQLSVVAEFAPVQKMLEKLRTVMGALTGRIKYAFSPEIGFYEADRINVGTGIVFQFLVSLPSLAARNQLVFVQNAIRAASFQVYDWARPATPLENDEEPLSPFFWIEVPCASQPMALLLLKVFDLLEELSCVEFQTYLKLAHEDTIVFKDRILRVESLMKSALLLPDQDFYRSCSDLRLSLYTIFADEPGCFTRPEQKKILRLLNEFFFSLLSTSLSFHKHVPVSGVEMEKLRADMAFKLFDHINVVADKIFEKGIALCQKK